MTNLEALHAAILANPDEDTPRLMYADCLAERGEGDDAERAEFIRVQVRSEEIRGGGCAVVLGTDCDGEKEWCVRCGLVRHGVGILGAYWPSWSGPVLARWHCDNLWPPKPTPTPHHSYRRGFVEQITCTAADWLAHADAMVWRPGQTVECPECHGKGGCYAYPADDPTNKLMHGETWYPCRNEECRDGRVPRPCPETAQPITRVVLTTMPHDLAPRSSIGQDIKFWLEDNWPGIEFRVLPLGET